MDKKEIREMKDIEIQNLNYIILADKKIKKKLMVCHIIHNLKENMMKKTLNKLKYHQWAKMRK